MSRSTTLRTLNRAYNLARHWEERVREAGHEYVYAANYRLLLALDKFDDPVSIGKVAEYLGVSVQTCGKSLKELHRNGYVDYEVENDDRRIRLVKLTNRGRRLLET